MKTINFIIFFSIFFTIYGLVNYYIFIRGWQVINYNAHTRVYYSIIFIFLSSSFIIGRLLERYCLNHVSSIFVWIGSFWLAAMTYFLLFIVFIDIIRLLNFIVPFISIKTNNQLKQILFLSAIIITTIIVIVGYINSISLHITRLNLNINKKSKLENIHIVAVSDIHLGTIIETVRLKKIIKTINSLKPDIVLLIGDIFDEDLGPVIKKNLGNDLTKINSKFGVFAVLGNHEYIGGVEQAKKYLIDHNITVLQDSVVHSETGIYLVGREDISIKQFLGKTRKQLKEILEKVDKNHPIILMDHQPFNLDEAINNGVDLQLSGHTHHGQLWPFNYLTRAIYKISYGYKKFNNTHFYVSSGVGTWGPPIRTNSRSEIVKIILNFKN